MIMDFNDIDFIYLDLDDTLWDFSANSPVSLHHVYDCFGFNRYATSYEQFRDAYLPKNMELWELYHYGKIDKDFLETERFRFTIEAIGDPRASDADFCAGVNDEYLRYLATLPGLVSGARELLGRIKSRGIPMGILSNGFAGIQQQKMISGGIDSYFREVVLSDEVGVTKPLSGIFDFAVRRAGTSPERILMIGDNYDADIVGAHNAGWKTLFFNRKHSQIPDGVADITVVSLDEIL